MIYALLYVTLIMFKYVRTPAYHIGRNIMDLFDNLHIGSLTGASALAIIVSIAVLGALILVALIICAVRAVQENKDAKEDNREKEFYKEYASYNCYLTTAHKQAYMRNQYGFYSEKFYPYQRLKAFLSYIDRAYEDIKYLKYENEELYEKLYTRITLESIPYRYMIITLYPKE